MVAPLTIFRAYRKAEAERNAALRRWWTHRNDRAAKRRYQRYTDLVSKLSMRLELFLDLHGDENCS